MGVLTSGWELFKDQIGRKWGGEKLLFCPVNFYIDIILIIYFFITIKILFVTINLHYLTIFVACDKGGRSVKPNTLNVFLL